MKITFVYARVKDGAFVEDADVRAAADAMLDELLALHGALSGLRDAS